MSRRTFATVDAVLVVICVMIFAGGVVAQTAVPATAAKPPSIVTAGDRP
jgi:hypothetical protein